MVLFLEILDGPLIGQQFRIEPGIAIGRKEGHILLADDAKVSGLHAKIDFDDRQRLVIFDQDSANGLYIGPNRVKKVTVLSGVIFRIGDTHFKIIELTAEKVKEVIEVKTWVGRLKELIVIPAKGAANASSTVASLSPAVELEFVRGPQAETVLTLGYGPRIGGSNGLDIEILEPACPEKAFEILPGPGCAQFLDTSKGKVLLNNKKTFSKVDLREGDVISIGKTQIKVRYL